MAKLNIQHSRRAMIGAKLSGKQKRAFRAACAREGFTQTDVLNAMVAKWMEARLPAPEFEELFPRRKDPLAS
jgi:ParG